MSTRLAALGACLAALSCSWLAPSYDLVIVGGTIVDGTGAAPIQADLGIREGRIVTIGALADAKARDRLVVSGLVVAPGFIDVHNHTDRAIADPNRRLNEAFVRQGVTTIVGGADGSASPGDIRTLAAAYDRNGVGTNVAFFVGHNALRREVMDNEARAPTPEEMTRLKNMVREGMELGALGFSTGLMYEPGMFSTTDEVIELAREVKVYAGVYDSHVRNPAHDLLGSDREAIMIGEKAEVPPKIAHEKAVGLENKGLIREVIALVNQARARGTNVVTDQYPYDGAATASLAEIIVVPDDLKTAPGFDLRAALGDLAVRRRLQTPSEDGINGGFAWLKATGYSHMRVTSSADYPAIVGRYLSELAKERGVSGFDLVSDLLIDAGAPIRVTLGAVDEQDVRELLVQSWNMIASDGAFPEGAPEEGHPRDTGTFPRVLGHYVRDVKLLSLPEGVRKMTSFPADYVGLRTRGRIQEDKIADLTIFDARTIADRSTWDAPQRMAEGVVHVLVDGVLVLRDGKMTGAAPGRFVERHR